MTGPSALTALDEALRAYDRVEAVTAAHRALDDGQVTISVLYEHLSDVLVRVGAQWQRGTTEVWQEHLISGIVRTVVESCALRVDAAAPAKRSDIAVLAAPADEYHDLGLRMLADRFALAGWKPYLLGAAVPLPQLLDAVRTLGARAVALNASTHFHRLNVRTYAEQLATAQPAVHVWVGGPAFASGTAGWESSHVLDPLAVPPPEDV